MSLINDALKRATKAPAATDKPDASAGPMQPADSHQSVGLPRYFLPVLLCIFCGATWFLVTGWDARRQAGLYSDAITVRARELPPETDAAASFADALPGATEASTAAFTPPADEAAAAAQTNPIPENRNFSLSDDDAPAPAAASVAPEPAAAPEPAYRLQGIFFRPASPSAVINAKTVFVGDLISGAKVRAISRQSVTLEHAGGTQVLTLQ